MKRSHIVWKRFYTKYILPLFCTVFITLFKKNSSLEIDDAKNLRSPWNISIIRRVEVCK